MEKKVFIRFLSIVLFANVSLYAISYKGQRIYAKTCVACHGKQEFIQSRTADEWRNVIGAKGEHLAQLHTKVADKNNKLKFFHSKKYKRNIRHLRDFLTEYAKDGKVPTCN